MVFKPQNIINFKHWNLRFQNRKFTSVNRS
jgi:hypothetical protein